MIIHYFLEKRKSGLPTLSTPHNSPVRQTHFPIQHSREHYLKQTSSISKLAMARLDPLSKSLNLDTSLKDAVIVLTGGSSGIGYATVQALSKRGAKVVFGDIQEPPSLPPASSFLETDVRIYDNILALFKHALTHHSRVDHAISIAGILERPGWFDPSAGIGGIETPPDLATEEVNLRGTLWFSHIAVQYLSHSATSDDNKSLTLVSSLAGFKETPGVPGIPIYEASKHGVIGLMRGLRLFLPKSDFKARIRVNTVCPGGTDTAMVTTIKDAMPHATFQSPGAAANIIVAVTAAGKGSQAVWYDGKNGQGTRRRKNRGGMDWDDDEKEARGMSGRSWFVDRGEAWDIEEGLDRTEDLWMGLEVSDVVVRNQARLGAFEWTESGGAKGEQRRVDVVPDS